MASNRKRKETWHVVVLALVVVTCLPVQAVGRLDVELRQVRPTDQSLAGSDGTMEVVLTNTGDQVIEVLEDDIPYQNKRGRLIGSAFEIIDPEGREADYNGIFVDYVNGVLRTLPLAPGGKEVRRVNIVRNYKVSAGQRYTVSLHPVRYLDRSRSAFPGTSISDLMLLMKSVETNRLHVLIDPRLDVQSIQARGKYSSMVNSSMACDGNKPAIFEAARSLAAQMATEAASHIATSYSYTFEPDGSVTGHFANSPRYVKWFGMHADPFGVESLDPVDNEIDTGMYTVQYRIEDDSSGGKPDATLTCQCTASDLPETYKISMAWVNPDEPYVINACENFWLAPDIRTARDENSRVGTIMHEAVHFNDSFWRGSGDGTDMGGRYSGQAYVDAANLALADRASAARNPNNYRFFVLNQNW